MDNESESNLKQSEHVSSEGAPGMTRREALLQLLRVGGIAAGAAGAGIWLSERSRRPVAESPEQARKDHRIVADQQWPQLTVAQYVMDGRGPQPGEPRALVAEGSRKSGRHGPIHRAPGRCRHQAQHRMGSHARAGRQHQSRSSSPKLCASAGRPAPSASSLPM